MTTQVPLSFSGAQLRAIAFKCGIPTTGTKALIAARINDELLKTASFKASGARANLKGKPLRVLSIDMGIRNLAYCVLDMQRPRNVKIQKPGWEKLPVLREWHRLAVSTPPVEGEPLDDEMPETAERILSKEEEKESFTPATMSRIAYKLLRNRLLLQDPAYVLIERQRYRSMGAGNVLEWTLRVNMLETIIHAVLCTLKEEGIFKGEVISISPGQASNYWLTNRSEWGPRKLAEGKERKTQSVKARNKGHKIDLVKRWLQEDRVIIGSTQAQMVATAYLAKWNRAPGGGPAVELEGQKMGKLDDLADSFLQGVAWIAWERNKRTALVHGVEALLEESVEKSELPEPPPPVLIRSKPEKSVIRLKPVKIPVV